MQPVMIYIVFFLLEITPLCLAFIVHRPAIDYVLKEW